MLDWIRTAIRPDIVRRSLKVGVIVGCILTTINHGDILVAGHLSGSLLWKIPMTFLVPYCVSTFAATQAIFVSRR